MTKMTMFYNLVDRNDHQYLGTFITSLSLKRLQELEYKADLKYNKTVLGTKSSILFELIKKEDNKFQELHPEEFEI